MSWHLVVHWLDDLRHFLAFTWSVYTWVGNVSAGVIIFAVTAMLWPKIRHAIEGWLDRKLVGHLEAHHQRVASLLEGHMKELHTHIDAASKEIT